MNLEIVIISALGSFVVGLCLPLGLLMPRVTRLERDLINLIRSVDEVKQGKINVVCPHHEELCRRLSILESQK